MIPLFVVLFLAAVLPDNVRTLVCRYTGFAMPEESCCPAEDAGGKSTPDQMQGESCCVVRTVHLTRMVSDRETSAAGPVHHQVFASVTPVEPYVDTAGATISRRPAVLAVGPPILLVKRAFLI